MLAGNSMETAKMRVTVDHWQKTTGLGGTQSQFVQCTVQFSEEEKAIIDVRGLHNHIIVVDPPTPPPSRREHMIAGILRGFSPLFFLIGLTLFMPSLMNVLFSGGNYGVRTLVLSAILFFGAPIAFGIGYLMDRSIDHRFTYLKQFVTVREMLLRPFIIHSPDPAHSDLIVEQVKERLAALKAIILGSAELREGKSYEL
jgi:hypothetical protein